MERIECREACANCLILLKENTKVLQRNAELLRRNAATQQRARHAEAEVRRLRMELDEANRRIDELSGQAKATSLNSSLPPSKDPPGVKRPAKAKPSGRRSGAQVGHKGAGRKLLPAERVTEVVRHRPQACPECGENCFEAEQVVARHQVMELPAVAVAIIEHQAISCRCGRCGSESRGQIPREIKKSVCGPRLSGAIGLLSASMHISRREVANLLSKVLGAPISMGTVMARERELAEVLAAPYEQLKQEVSSAAVKYVDETGWRRAEHWLWVAATEQAVVFQSSHARTYGALQHLLGEEIEGVLCTDRFGVYDKHPQSRRGICWAHLKRDFQRCVDRGGRSELIGQEGLKIVKEVFDCWRWLRRGKIKRSSLWRKLGPLRRRMKQVLRQGMGLKIPKTSRFCRNLMKRWGPMWRFAEVEHLEPTNNLAERMLRGAVIWRKVSLGSQSRAGCRFVERMLSVVMTLKLSRQSVLDYLSAAIEAQRKGLPPPAMPLREIQESDGVCEESARRAA